MSVDGLHADVSSFQSIANVRQALKTCKVNQLHSEGFEEMDAYGSASTAALARQLALRTSSAGTGDSCFALLTGGDFSDLYVADCKLDAESLAALGTALEGRATERKNKHVVADDISGGEGLLGTSVENELNGQHGVPNPEIVSCHSCGSSCQVLERVATALIGASMRPALSTLAMVNCTGVMANVWSLFWRKLPATLVQLDLSGNGLSDHAVNALCGVFQHGGCPATLVLKGNRCKDVERLCGYIADGNLIQLDLAENTLNDKSTAQLCKALESPAVALQYLRLCGNQRLTSAGLGGLVDRLPSSPIRVLGINQTSFCDVGAAALAAVLPRCTLDLLCVEGTRVSDDGARRLLQAVETSPGVSRFCTHEDTTRVCWQRCNELEALLAGQVET